MNTTLCWMAVQISESMPIRVSHMQQILGSLLGIVTLSYFVCKRHKMPQLLGGSTRVLIWWMIAFVLIHNIFLCLIDIWSEIKYFTYSDGCELVMQTWQCLLFRVPTIASVIGISVVYMILLLDRMYSIFLPKHYSTEKAPLLISVAVILFVSILTTIIFFEEDLTSYKHYCVAGSSKNANRLGIVYAFLFCSYIMCTFGFILIMRHSFVLLKGNKHNFIVNEKLRIRMDIASMRFMIAGIVCSFVFIGTFLFSNYAFRQMIAIENFVLRSSWIDITYIIQWYGVVLFALLYNWKSFSMGHSRIIDVSDERQIHFQQLSSLWN